MTVYCSPAEMLSRYDVRLVGDLVQDAGVQDPNPVTNPNLAAMLEDASAAIDAAVYVGDRYTPDQMASLSDQAAAFCRRLCTDLALIYLKRRRGRYDAEKDKALQEEVDKRMQGLRDGANLLLLEDQTEAPASVIDLVRPRLIGVRRSTDIRTSTQNYYPFNPDRNQNSNS